MAASYLSRAASNGNQKTYTISVWVKSTVNYGYRVIVGSDMSNDAANHATLAIDGDNLKFYQLTSNDWGTLQVSTRALRDSNSWYHIVARVDTTQSTAADRVRLYVNNEQVVKFSYNYIPDQNEDTAMFRYPTVVGARRITNPDYRWSGYMGHLHICEGQSYAPTKFGEYDSTTGEWKPTLSPTSVSYGDNGAFLKFENASALGTDSSGQGHTFTVHGDMKQSISTTSNNFNTINYNEAYTVALASATKYGGTSWKDAYPGYDGIKGATGNLGMASGKWYYEMKYTSPAMYSNFGIGKANTLASSKLILDTQRAPWYQGNEGDGFGFRVGSTTPVIFRGDNTEVTWLTNSSDANSAISPATNGQICMCAFDLDAGKIWWGINGTWNTVPGSTTTTSSAQIASGANAHKTWTPTGAFYRTGHSEYNRFGNAAEQLLNFGEGRFGVTAVASGNADSAGEGVFEYAPPTNFLAICTKNIKNTG